MLIRKTIRLNDVQIKMDDDGAGSFAGYASVFGGVDSYGDTIKKGAFRETLKSNGLPKMFFNHDWSMPVGKWTSAKEDDHGLYVEGELTPGHSLAADVHAALKHGTLDGLSIGGMLKGGDFETTDTGRLIKRWSNLMEVSPVVFPADSAARIDASSVKGEEFAQWIQDELAACESVRDFEFFLRDASGLSKGAAQAFVARAKALFARRDSEENEVEAKTLADIAARLKRLERVAA